MYEGVFLCLLVHQCEVAEMNVIQQVILQTLLRKADEKVKDGERILKEHENVDSTMAVSKTM